MSEAKQEQLEALEKEVEVSFYQASGPGGQHRNRTYSAVRVVHLPTGTVVTSADSRSQHRNRRQAMERLLARLEEQSKVRVPRIPTRKGRGAHRREREQRDRHARKKSLRRPPSED